MEINWSDAARDEFLAHITYIAERNPDAAEHISATILATIDALRSFPMIGRPGQVDNTRERAVPGTAYLIVYGIISETIEIYHIHHGRQNWRQ